MRAQDQFEPAVVLQAVVATYVACAVGTSFFLFHPIAWVVALAVMLYALPPGILTLTATYLWVRRDRRAWFRFGGCLVAGAVGGVLWGALVLLITKRSEEFPLSLAAFVMLVHAVSGATGGLVFWTLAFERMRQHAEASR
jgi:hypothetical protein